MISHLRARLGGGIAAVAILVLAASGCSKKEKGITNPEPQDFSAVLFSFAHEVVVPTYTDLAAKARSLHTTIVDFEANPGDQAKLNAAATAWVAAREPWEKSEAFLFGPAAYLSIDPSLDSWPVDRTQLDGVLASNFPLTAQFISQGLGPALRGFHTIEYLLFRDGAPRIVGDMTPRERDYLVAVSQVLLDDATALRDEWVNHFATEFSDAGKSGSRYATQADAVREMIEGMSAICDEVANGKIADPYDQQDVELEESQFSYNSLTDFQNNIRSVEDTYKGGYNSDPSGSDLESIVHERDAALDARVKNEISAAIAAIAAIPAPFHNNLDKSVQIEAAQQAIDTVRNTMEQDVKPLVLQ